MKKRLFFWITLLIGLCMVYCCALAYEDTIYLNTDLERVPIGNEEPVFYTINNERRGATPEIHACSVQPVTGSFQRFTISFTLPENLGVSIYDSESFMYFSETVEQSTNGKKQTLVFDIADSKLMEGRAFVVKFFDRDQKGSVFLVVHPKDNMIHIHPEHMPVDEGKTVRFVDLRNRTNPEATVHRCIKQTLDNGSLRFTIDHSFPAGLNIFVFDTPDGQRIRYRGITAADDHPSLIFDVHKDDADLGELTINFWDNRNENMFYFDFRK